ncbi:selenocysteine-specific elongation factor [Desulfurobacterium pacificum]|uniref:Selenocysteine-specific elongation factor n=1 Tax=Desulfurobacterium pacificum TaxID=240166 RepID=A0ABY1NPJ0_9BACT|nr:selenocysteine-specific translation elongation factor [Desulfurobacterium pacificum]SMP14310.1 selenocysteine-specific elongation factor [Desulfurobacterium pacificum]
MQSKKFIVIGTAGHIDHGKTTLIKALTGIDTDRWEEEKKRGMTIDIGFANLELPSGIFAGIVDVPGHEKFIKNMLAGASGIDLVLFVIAADEGVMPQTKEHLTVCQTLGTKKGIIVLTKKDTVDEEWLELVKEDVKDFVKGTFLENAPLIAVSSKTDEGIKELVKEIDRIAQTVEPKTTEGILRLPVDRSFTVKGFGTVITGTLLSGKVKVGDTVEILPEGRTVKVRNIQVHGKNREEALAGQRTALNLSDVSKEDVERGDVIATPGYLKPTKIVDVELSLSKDADVIVQPGHKIHFHHLTKETEGEVFLIDKDELLPGESALAQIRLKEEIVPVYDDRFVIRNYSPARVIGGGKIVFPLPERKFRRKFRKEKTAFLKKLTEGSEKEKAIHLIKTFPGKLTDKSLTQLLNIPPEKAQKLIKELTDSGTITISDKKLYPAEFKEKLKEQILTALSQHHKKFPISEGINRESLKTSLSAPPEMFSQAISELLKEGKIEEIGAVLKLKGFTPHHEGTPFESKVEKIVEVVRNSRFTPPEVKELAKEIEIPEEEANLIASYLQLQKGFVKIGEHLFSPEAMKEIVSILKNHFKNKETLTVGEFKDYLNVSRKFAIPLLEFLDSKGITVRKGNERVAGNLEWKT